MDYLCINCHLLTKYKLILNFICLNLLSCWRVQVKNARKCTFLVLFQKLYFDITCISLYFFYMMHKKIEKISVKKLCFDDVIIICTKHNLFYISLNCITNIRILCKWTKSKFYLIYHLCNSIFVKYFLKFLNTY